MSDNQQGHSPETEEEVSLADAAPVLGELVQHPSIAGVFLWCQTPTGPACQLASAALGTGPKDVSGLPPSLLTVEDRPNDCEESTVAEIARRLNAAFTVQPTGWRDQVGGTLDASLLADMYQAAGCINDADPSRPIAKISAASVGMPRVYLVRVWDGQAVPTY